MTPLSLIIVRNPFLDFAHLEVLIDALNRQTSDGFNTFWIDQSDSPELLEACLRARARFPWLQAQVSSPKVAGVVCWELISGFAALMKHPGMGEVFTYLHMECIPEQDFVESILSVVPALGERLGYRWIAMLEQLWTNLAVEELQPGMYWDQLRQSELLRWSARQLPYQPPPRLPYTIYQISKWRENAFLMPTALARELGLYSAVKRPLFFQDLFDIFHEVQDRPYFADIAWISLTGSLLYHLHHPRPFLEYTQAFIDAIPRHPELFGDLTIYRLLGEQDEYRETDDMRRQNKYTDQLDRFYYLFRHAENGTNKLWLKALDAFHGYIPTPSGPPPESDS